MSTGNGQNVLDNLSAYEDLSRNGEPEPVIKQIGVSEEKLRNLFAVYLPRLEKGQLNECLVLACHAFFNAANQDVNDRLFHDKHCTDFWRRQPLSSQEYKVITELSKNALHDESNIALQPFLIALCRALIRYDQKENTLYEHERFLRGLKMTLLHLFTGMEAYALPVEKKSSFASVTDAICKPLAQFLAITKHSIPFLKQEVYGEPLKPRECPIPEYILRQQLAKFVQEGCTVEQYMGIKILLKERISLQEISVLLESGSITREGLLWEHFRKSYLREAYPNGSVIAQLLNDHKTREECPAETNEHALHAAIQFVIHKAKSEGVVFDGTKESLAAIHTWRQHTAICFYQLVQAQKISSSPVSV